ncbi:MULTISPECIES: hypothetical protein [unclassified Streptomyces]|uniref:hypothetical protein n=1 Tax=unclassified Streptomyces TaxID=2593676 RepID=UPI0003628091|nr:hypothetical protein [Streptomyces sp. BoleA5]MYX38995.1 hypothetical protein [Streptomyces sp. SID8377]
MEAATTKAVFAEAARSTSWKVTNLGPVTEVSHNGYTYSVQLPPANAPKPYPAAITYREGCGGTDFLDVPATWAQTAGIVESAMAASRLL